ncbi:carbon catabolite repressor protein 4 homolog 5 isoform X1 [Amaranthus tricolor]|uniref:carbon catabolite repressor protein 4 homolog 5 isoform X1 n=1 Tax=Amaranthus tricolor TaxID=29722 RepID=UPI00258935FA|nr:carbon catabolite repressor protein 4 homolog 5 isoform X1 [Amaranthus tricolor]
MNSYYSCTRYNSYSKKRKFVHEEIEQEQTLKSCIVRRNSKSSSSIQSYSSYQRQKHTKQKSRTHHSYRKWSYSDYDSSAGGDKLVLVSYNVLGVENASRHPDLYYNVPLKYLNWDHRKLAIYKELAQYDPSIVCFQEVDRFNDLHDALKQDGFEGILKARTGDAQDGCAIFWKHKRFKLMHEESIEFQSFGLRNNVAQFCVLKMNDDGLNSDRQMSNPTTLLVGNIHVLFNPNRGDIKLGQVRLFLERAHILSKKWGGIPIVLAGDFNSVPQSAVYQYISSAKLHILEHDRKRVSQKMPLYHTCYTKSPFRRKSFTCRWRDEEVKLATGNEKATCLQHNLNLRSAYVGVPGNVTLRDNMGEPLTTSCHSKFMGTVDYIWHTEQLVPVRVLETISGNALDKMGGLPSKNWGSDHVALACEFAFANREA